MSDFEDNIHSSSPQVDLLVDGELNEADRRELLFQLEHEPDGWRRCALAFLEAQCWKAELGQMGRSEPRPAGQAQPTVSEDEPRSRQPSWRQYAATTLSIAASFLLALVIGMGLRGDWPGGLHSPESTSVRKATEEFPLVKRDAVPGALAAQAGNNWETVTLTANGQPESFRVPAVRRDTLDENLLTSVPDAISPELLQAFERSGHQVVQQREIVPVQMKDGRRLVVPVDHVEIHYVGRPSL